MTERCCVIDVYALVRVRERDVQRITCISMVRRTNKALVPASLALRCKSIRCGRSFSWRREDVWWKCSKVVAVAKKWIWLCEGRGRLKQCECPQTLRCRWRSR